MIAPLRHEKDSKMKAKIIGIIFLSTQMAAALPPTPVPTMYIPGRTYEPNAVSTTPVGTGKTYYVDGTNGSDAYNGLSVTTAFKSISMAATMRLAVGDNILIRSGLYRERIVLNANGTSANPITLGHYDGDGEVIIDASEQVAGWTLVSGQIYKAQPGFSVQAVVADKAPLFPEFSSGALKEGTYYYDSASGNLSVWVPGGGSPAAHDIGVIDASLEPSGIDLQESRYVTVFGLTIRFAPGYGLYNYAGGPITVEQCKTIFNGKGGIVLDGADSRVIKCFVYHNVLANWPRGKWAWGGWPSGLGACAAPNVLFEGNISQKNGGEGILSYEGCNGARYRNNISIDNWSTNYYIDQEKNVELTGNIALAHQPDLHDAYNNGSPGPDWDYKVPRMLLPMGIMTADEIYGENVAHLDSVTIANNVIMGCRCGITHYAMAKGSGYRHVKILNNTIVVALWARLSDEAYVGIRVSYNNGNNIGCEIRNNILYSSHTDGYLLDGSIDQGESGSLFANIAVDHNLFYAPSLSRPIHWGTAGEGTYDYTYTQWAALSGGAHGAGDVTGDPKFIAAALTDNVYAKRLTAPSAAIDAGTVVPLSKDFDGKQRPLGSGIDMGAFEFDSSVSAIGYRKVNVVKGYFMNEDEGMVFDFLGRALPKEMKQPRVSAASLFAPSARNGRCAKVRIEHH
jgi:hypothetical protein